MVEKFAVSVLMPVFNSAIFVEEAVKSIVSQDFGDFEFIILDDCSTDGSFEIVSKLTEADIRLKVFRNEKNMGVVATRNRLIDLSSGSYIAIIDSDDIAMPGRLQRQFDFLECNPDIGFVGTDAQIIDEKGNGKGFWLHQTDHEKLVVEIMFYSPFVSSSVMFRRVAIPEKKYDPYYTVAEDFELYSRIAQNWKIANLNTALVKYRLNDTGLSSKNKQKMEECTVAVIKKYLKVKGIDIDVSAIEEYRKIFTEKIIEKTTLSKIEDVLKVLKEQIIEKEIFELNAIDAVFQKVWFEACRKSSLNGLLIYRKFFDSSLFAGSIRYSDKLRLFLRCFSRC